MNPLSSHSVEANSSIVWRCPKTRGEQCLFFLWEEHEAAAKEWLHISQLPPVPQTPSKTSVRCGDPDISTISGLRDQHSMPQIPETPFTMAKRKRVSSKVTNHHDHNDHCNQNVDGNRSSLQSTGALDDPFTHSSQPSKHTRKAAKNIHSFYTRPMPRREASKPYSIIANSQLTRLHVREQQQAFSTPTTSITGHVAYARSVQ